MDRLACIDVPALPLQRLLHTQPDWADHPVAVVALDKPQGQILWVNERARQCGILPGQRYATGLSLSRDLRAAVVAPADVEQVIDGLVERLRCFTPEIEPCADEPGVFWLNATGLERLYPSLNDWAQAIRHALQAEGFEASLVVGFTRFGGYAVAKGWPGLTVFDDAEQEAHVMRQMPLDRLHIDPKARDALTPLGIRTVGDLLKLPSGGLRSRFGPATHRLYRMARGELWMPLKPQTPEPPVRQRLGLEHPEQSATRLLFLVKRLLHPLLTQLAERHEALSTLHLQLLLEHAEPQSERIRPAAPTLEPLQILELVRLRLEAVELGAGVTELRLTAEGAGATSEQLQLFAELPKRDLAAAERALARVRTEFGDDAVVRARLQARHLPEAHFRWEPLTQMTLPQPSPEGPLTLVRRLLSRPSRLPERRQGELRRALATAGRQRARSLPGTREDTVMTLMGPYVISGGWWRREIHRAYHFAETREGELLWVFYDRAQQAWFVQGRVE